MSITLAEFEKQALRLPLEDRVRLVQALIESLQELVPVDVGETWEREIRERVASFDRERSPTYSADEVFAEVRRPIP